MPEIGSTSEREYRNKLEKIRENANKRERKIRENFERIERIKVNALKENEEKFINIKSLKDIKGYKGATLDNTDPFYYNLKEAEKKEKMDLNIIYSTSDIDSLIEVVRNNFVDYSLIGNYTKYEDLSFLDVSFLFNPIEVCFIYRKNESFTTAIEKLIKISNKLDVKPII